MTRVKRVGMAHWRGLLLGAVLLGAGSFWLVCLARAQGGITVQFSAANYNANEGSTCLVTVTLSSMPMSQVTVNYSTANGTAVAPDDYVASSGQLTFAPFQTSQSFSVTIMDDVVAEPTETINLSLSAPIGASLGSQSTATITIADNDGTPPTVQFYVSSFSVGEDAGSAIIWVSLSQASMGTVSVNYATSDSTAVSPGDYTSTTGTLSFAQGEMLKTFTVPIINDTLVEGTEEVVLSLSNPVNATLGTLSSATLDILDDETPCPN